MQSLHVAVSYGTACIHSVDQNLGGLKRWKKWIEHWLEREGTYISIPESLQQLYISFVRLHLDYAAQVWDFQLQKDVDKLEKKQKFALWCAQSIDWLEMTAYFLVSTSPFWKTDTYISSPLLLNGQPVDFVNSIRYLGLTISANFFSGLSILV